MSYRIKTSIERKFEKHRLVYASNPQVDFIADLAQNLILEQLEQYLESALAPTSEEAVKGVLLFEQANNFVSALKFNGVEFDQIPFPVSALRASQLEKMLQPAGYQILLSNLALDWLDAATFIQRVQKLLAPQGVCWFSAYGRDTAMQSSSILATLDSTPHFNAFYNLQDIGDALLGAGFKDVVVESNSYKLEYVEADALLADAVKVFGVNLHPDKRKTLSPKGLRRKFIAEVDEIIRVEGKYVEEVEILIAYARKAPDITPVFAPQDFPVRVT